MRIEVRSITKEEEDLLYGDRKIDAGLAFKEDDNHYYLQRLTDVLHINTTGLINRLHVGALNGIDNLVPIKYIEFENEIRKLIYNLEINQYWK